MPATAIAGLHHVTAISGPPQPNVTFFTGTLAQRLVKKTVNFDAPDTYHLYYGDAHGNPGTILTFFPFAHAGPGKVGPGMASAYAYAVPKGAFDGWVDRLADSVQGFDGVQQRLGQRMLTLRDPDGAAVELIETDRTGAEGLDGFHSVTLWVDDPDPTARLLVDVFGYQPAGAETLDGTQRLRFAAPGTERGNIVDVIRSDRAPQARPGTGTIHHVAFRARSDDEQRQWQERLARHGHPTTPVIDRQYFHAIYFREPGGILFEIATDPPGFAVDEPAETMGEALMLPPQHERLRSQIERILPPLGVGT